MTREEAVKILKTIKMLMCRPDGTPISDGCEAIDMAIESLSREQKKYDAICNELLELKIDLNLPIEVVMAYEKSIGVVRKYAKMGDTE